MSRGQLRIYLGAAPGVGKTFAMLGEGRRRASRGTDVVVGIVETHGRAHTAEQIGELEVVPRRVLVHRERSFSEMDVDAVIARRPEVVLVDELAHTNVPGSCHAKRWEDVEELLDAGIDVISTVNIQHLESLNDVVESITGIAQQERIPDAVVRKAEQVELVDMTPEALRRRMAHGNVYPAERIDTALTNYFRPGNLAALRELALMWLADRVDDALRDYRERHGIERPWETRERVVVALTGAPSGGHLIRRAARIAARRSADLVGVHVRATDGLANQEPRALSDQRRLLQDLGGTYHEIAGGDTARSLVDFARSQNATQIVLGASHRNRWQQLVGGSIISTILRSSGSIDVHVISSELADGEAPEGGRGAVDAALADLSDGPVVHVRPDGPGRWDALVRRAIGPFSERRALASWGFAVSGPVLATILLDRLRDQLGLPSVLLVYLLVAVLAASAGGWAPGLFAATASFLLANWYFTPPVHTFTIGELENVVALCIFLAVAGLMSVFVAQAARRSVDASRARAHAETLVAMAGTIATDDDPLRALVRLLQVRYGAGAVAVLHRHDDIWSCEASSGVPVPLRPDDADVTVPLDDDTVLVFDDLAIDGAAVGALQTFGQHLALAIERRRLRVDAAAARRASEANELRGALLAAVSHDLRTPLATVKAAASSLRQPDVAWTADERAEFLGAIEDGADQLERLITNLLGMSRIQAGAVELAVSEVGFDEIVPAALVGLDTHGVPVDVEVAESLPRVRADAALLERAVANLIDNACKWSPPGQRVCVRADAHAGQLGLIVVDRGPGVPKADRESIFQPFQRLGDGVASHDVKGAGLGLAVAQGFVRLMGGEILVEDTPGGGTTMVLTLPEALVTTATTRVLIVDDEAAIRRTLEVNLVARGYVVSIAATGEEALALAATHHPDLAVVDLGLPGISGRDVIAGIRGWSTIPIIILSARDAESEKVAALDAGADDYVTKPFGIDEFLARLRAALRRASHEIAEPIVRTDAFTIDLAAKKVWRGPDATDEVRLTPTEWHVVEVLVRHSGRLVTQRQLLQEVWGPQYGEESNYLRVFMATIRRKLEDEPSRPRHFVTEPGMGYRFEP